MTDKTASLLKLSAEAKVGLFVLLGIILLVYMSLRLGGIQFGRSEGYLLHVEFASAAGVDKDAAVRVAGVEVGKVKEIKLKDSRAQLVLQIQPDVRIGKDFMAVLTTKGLLGEKYLELMPGSPNAPALKDGDTITRTTSYADMDKLITILSDVSNDIKSVTESLSKALGGKEGEQSLKNIVKNIEEISYRLNRVIDKNDARFESILKNLDDFSTVLKNDGPLITQEIRTAAKNLNEAIEKTSGNLNGLIDENRGNLKEGVENLRLAAVRMQEAMDSINKIAKEAGPEITTTVASASSIARKLDKGEGTLGKLINDPIVHDNLNKTITGINNYIDKTESFHTYLGYRTEYLNQSSKAKSYFSLRIQPSVDKQYMIDLVSDPVGKRKKETKETTVGGTTTRTDETTMSESFKFSVQIAKRFSDLMLRGGIIESTGGAGVDYYMLKDRVRLSLEAFDFTRKGKAHAKAGATVRFYKYFYLTGGYDDFLNKNYKSSYVGLGLEFNDDDIKYLLSSAPPVSF